MHELAVADVDAHVRRTGRVGLEEHQIAWFHPTHDAMTRVVLGVGRARQTDAEQSEDVLYVTRAIKTVRACPAENVRHTQEAQRAAG